MFRISYAQIKNVADLKKTTHTLAQCLTYQDESHNSLIPFYDQDMFLSFRPNAKKEEKNPQNSESKYDSLVWVGAKLRAKDSPLIAAVALL